MTHSVNSFNSAPSGRGLFRRNWGRTRRKYTISWCIFNDIHHRWMKSLRDEILPCKMISAHGRLRYNLSHPIPTKKPSSGRKVSLQKAMAKGERENKTPSVTIFIVPPPSKMEAKEDEIQLHDQGSLREGAVP